MIRALALAGVAFGLSGCMAAPAWLTIVAPTLSYFASVNNVSIETLRFIDDREQVCPVALAALQRCPVTKILPPAP